MIPGFLGYEMYFYSISMTGFIPMNTVRVTFPKMQTMKCLFHSKHMRALKISVNSIIEAVRFLLQHEVKCVLAERFSQDPLENYFGRQRTIGGRNHNPAARYFECNDTSIRNQKVFQPIAGNVRGADKANIEFTDGPVPCRKK